MRDPKPPAKLKADFVRKVTTSKPRWYGDGRGGHGLTLRVRPSAVEGRMSKSWAQRIVIAGRPTMIGLGAYPFVSLDEARKAAEANAKTARAGLDPRRPAAAVSDFAACFVATLDLHRPSWRSARTERQWRSEFDRFVLPAIGHLPIEAVGREHVLAILAAVWADKPTVGQRLAQRIGLVFRYAMGAGLRSDDPTPAAVAALPRQRAGATHHKAIPHAELGAAMVRVAADPAPVSPCWRFIALTACRLAEASGATFGEIDGDTWTIPAHRTKVGRPHRVALSPAALRIIDEQRDRAAESGTVVPDVLVFPSAQGKVMSSSVFHALGQRCGLEGTVHGLRTSFRTWAADTGVPREVAEAALAHVVGGVEGAYQRSDVLDARREVMADWATYLAA